MKPLQAYHGAPVYQYAKDGGLRRIIPPNVRYSRPERVLFVYRRGRVLALFPDIRFKPDGERREHIKAFVMRGSRQRWIHLLPAFLELPHAGRPDYLPIQRRIMAVAYPDLLVMNEGQA